MPGAGAADRGGKARAAVGRGGSRRRHRCAGIAPAVRVSFTFTLLLYLLLLVHAWRLAGRE